MGLQIGAKKNFFTALKKFTVYLKSEFGKTVAEDFNNIVLNKLDLIVAQPNIGVATAVKNTQSVIVGKVHQNKIYYRVEKNKLIIINLIDVRQDPKKNPFNKNS